MDKIKTIIIEDGQLIQDSGITVLTNDYIELIPKNYIVKYLKFNLIFKNLITDNTVSNEDIVNNTRFPFIQINGESCPIMIQEDYEIKSEDRFHIESLKINRDIGLGHMTMILVNYGTV